MKPEERWQSRFRAPRVTLPVWAKHIPARSVYRSSATGTWEIYAWDRSAGTTRQVTVRPNGTNLAKIDPSGQWIWWFADTSGGEFGVWMRQPFLGGPDEPATPGLQPAQYAGLALGPSGTAVVGEHSMTGSRAVLVAPGQEPRTIYEHADYAQVVGISMDGGHIAINHSEHGDPRHPGLKILRQSGAVVTELCDGPGKGLYGVRFAPAPGDTRLLAIHERRGRPEPLVWDVKTGDQREVWLRLPGEIIADWYEDCRSLLIVHRHRGRNELYRYDLASGQLFPLPTTRGVISEAATRPDGVVEYCWSSASSPLLVRSTGGQVVMHPPGPAAPPSVPAEDADVEGPGGRIHALVSRPDTGLAPYPAVFLVHGGPTWHDDDSFLPEVAAWVDHGFVVIRVNYRGSTGYGTAWRDSVNDRIGLTELEDIGAVRTWAVKQGLVDPTRLVLAGATWGGYLTLLGLGTQPDDWALGIAANPVADSVAAYEDAMRGAQSFTRSLFGGSPAEVPSRYKESSPINYVAQVTSPILVLAGENDPRYPIRQVDNYVAQLAAFGREHEVYRYEAGHGALLMEERIRQMSTQLAFARKHLGLA
ncbi:S9 family peptidase [Rhizohabitans arisaemae]|uniref:S9 family peptidase n=1 Tax=Rhizohabitans arisaemae TaxID=2720610 RepID=UPI0024B09A7A|nr:prolyl oligopeptidase family serine peptidase [Rhizohabitans arisaemae]